MSGFQEILLIVIILLAIFFIPRLSARNAHPPPLQPAVRPRRRPLSGSLRLAILVSVVWGCANLLYLQPWTGEWVRFGAIGVLPLVIVWGLYWVLTGKQPMGRSGRPLDRRR